MRYCFPMLLLSVFLSVKWLFAQLTTPLAVEKMMQGEQWIGVSPSHVDWDVNSRTIYFNWCPAQENQKSAYQVSVGDDLSIKTLVSKILPSQKRLVYSLDRSKVLFEENGDIILKNTVSGEENHVTNTEERESDPLFNEDETKVVFRKGNNLYCVSILGGQLTQLTNFTTAEVRDDRPNPQASEVL